MWVLGPLSHPRMARLRKSEKAKTKNLLHDEHIYMTSTPRGRGSEISGRIADAL